MKTCKMFLHVIRNREVMKAGWRSSCDCIGACVVHDCFSLFLVGFAREQALEQQQALVNGRRKNKKETNARTGGGKRKKRRSFNHPILLFPNTINTDVLPCGSFSFFLFLTGKN